MDPMETTPSHPSPAPLAIPHLVDELIAAIGQKIVAAEQTSGVLVAEAVYSTVQEHLGEKLRAVLEESMAGAVAEVAELAETVRAVDADWLAGPRYADAPPVTAWVRWKATDGERRITGASRKVTIPAGWLARQDRTRLQHAVPVWDADDDNDESCREREWIARELGLAGEHDGEVELDFGLGEEADHLTEWLAATETAG